MITLMLLLVGFHSLSASWTAPTAVPPDSNTLAPLNVGTTTQVKAGNLTAAILGATTEMRSNRYCDALGGNCFLSGGVVNTDTGFQFKNGPFTSTILGATTEVRSNRYCDAVGGNCFAPGSTGTINPVGSTNWGYAWVGGMLFQWGKVCPSSGTWAPFEGTYNFHIPFPNAAFSITGTRDTLHAGATRANFNAEIVSRSQFRAGTPGGLAGCTNWLAIGY